MLLVIMNCGYLQVIHAVMFLTGAIGIKIAIAKILGIADDVSELFSFLLNSNNCYTKPLTHLSLFDPDSNPLPFLDESFVPWENGGLFLPHVDEIHHPSSSSLFPAVSLGCP